MDMLNIMEAHVALMELENVRILKEMRNSVNRKGELRDSEYQQDRIGGREGRWRISCMSRDTVWLGTFAGRITETLPLHGLQNPEATLKGAGDVAYGRHRSASPA